MGKIKTFEQFSRDGAANGMNEELSKRDLKAFGLAAAMSAPGIFGGARATPRPAQAQGRLAGPAPVEHRMRQAPVAPAERLMDDPSTFVLGASNQDSTEFVKEQMKKAKKAGVETMPGKLPLERQYGDLWKWQNAKDSEGRAKFVLGQGTAPGGTYEGAKLAATEQAKLDLQKKLRQLGIKAKQGYVKVVVETYTLDGGTYEVVVILGVVAEY